MPRSTGKYAAVLGKLPKLVEDTPYQERVNKRKLEMLAVRDDPDEFVFKAGEDLDKTEEGIRREIKTVIVALVTINHYFKHAAGKSPSHWARVYAEARGVKDVLEEHESELNLNIEAIQQLLIETYETEDVSSLKTVDGHSVRVQHEPHATVMDRDRFREWCVKNGLERSLALAWQTTNSIVKERLLKGLPEPDGVEAKYKTKVVLTRGDS